MGTIEQLQLRDEFEKELQKQLYLFLNDWTIDAYWYNQFLKYSEIVQNFNEKNTWQNIPVLIERITGTNKYRVAPR